MVAAGASLALVLLVGALLFPTTPDAVHAEETTKATLAIQPTLAVTLPNTVNFEVQPTAAGAVTSGSATLSISTNNETGYSLYLSTADDNNALHSINPDTQQTITALTRENTTADNFTNNTWGYNLSKDTATDSTTYQSVPTTQPSDPQIITEAPTTDTYNLTFAAKVDSSLPSGTYTNTVTVSVVTNPALVVDYFNGISTMQEMTTEVCQTAAANETARLRDTRDGKLYWVAKLADGNCWMTQNLDYDIPASGLTSDDSDINNDSGVWNSSSTYAPQATSKDINVMWSTSSTDAYSFDPGLYVNTTPTNWDYCSDVAGYNNSSCADVGWADVSSMSPMATERTDGIVVDGNTYDAHYLVGNYYQWNAATAGTGGTTSYLANATDSICPKGWQLPISRNSDSRSFGGLTTAYGIEDNSDGASSLRKPPLYFIPAGYVRSSTLSNAGNRGYYWSSTAASGYNAYDLRFYSGYVYPSNYDYRYSGQSVRCLAR